jgi:tRNA threonylcarbamoyladenosine biosynthesis protein TsaB
MKLLGIDTASSHASAAIVENGRLISEKIHRPKGSIAAGAGGSRNDHAENLVPLIESALQGAALFLSDISGCAVAIGPGSFTGLRIGLSTAKGLCYGSGIPVVGVSTLHAIAARIRDFSGVICPVLDARKKEVYAALFHARAGFLERLSDDVAVSCDRLGELLRQFGPSEPILLAGDGATVYGEPLIASVGRQVHICQDATLPTTATAVALLGEACLASGTALAQVLVSPRYLRGAGAELCSRKSA